MRRLRLIGIGAGDPDFLTVQAIEALNSVDVFIVLDKAGATGELTALREHICARFITGEDYRILQVTDPRRDRATAAYTDAVLDWHQRRTELLEDLLLREVSDGQVAAILVWGDPSLYDSTLRIAEALTARGKVPLEYDVIPGITSVQALTARHRISQHRVGKPVVVTTGRRISDGLDLESDSVVVMLDAENSFQKVDVAAYDIYWGAYLGTPDEILIRGPLAEVAGQIITTRAEARERKGWVFDIYLLRRTAVDAHDRPDAG